MSETIETKKEWVDFGAGRNIWAKQATKARKSLWVLKFGILLYTSVSHIEGEINLVGEGKMSIHESFLSLVVI